ncbi:transcriptional regulator [Burkholderia sp. Ch1-1]|nr:transcriptional regulator [Burkholderia sp. Ch1-1]
MKVNKIPKTSPASSTGTRDLIVTTALLRFSEDGFENVSMRAIAAEVGINPATVYHHFKDKQALYEEVLRSVYRTFAQSFVATLEGKGTGAARLRRYVEEFCHFAFHNRQFLKLIKRSQLDGDAGRMSLMQDPWAERQLAACQAVIREVRPDLDPVFAAFGLHALILHHYEAMDAYRGTEGWTTAHEDPRQVARFVLGLYLPGTA